MQILAKDFLSGIAHEYCWEDGRFTRIRAADTSVDALPYMAPGLFDIQVNGFGGVDFNNPITPQEWRQANETLTRHGCTHFFATLITNSRECQRELLEGLERFRRDDPLSGCRGYHMEGPFLNPDPTTRGAHNPEWMTAADEDVLAEWRKIAGENLRLITLAPEVEPEKALAFIRKAVAQGIRIAMGHSLATGKILDEAVDAGASCWTHLGNALGKINDKFDNVLFHALGKKNLHASLIPDGLHVPPYAFSAMARALGAERLFLTTDAMSAAGAAPGKYRVCQHEITVHEDFVARTAEGRLAGSTLTPFDAIFKAAAMSDLPWQALWEAFSTRPAQWLGFEHSLREKNEASFCLISNSLSLEATYLKGERVDPAKS